MTRVIRRKAKTSTPDSAEIRRRIERRAEAWREQNPDATSALKRDIADRKGITIGFWDPAATSVLAIRPDRIGKLLGANSTGSGRKI